MSCFFKVNCFSRAVFSRAVFYLVLFFSLLFSLFLCSNLIAKDLIPKELVDKIAASVNDEIILISELKNMPARIKKQGAIDETLLLGENLDSLKNDKKAQLNFLIREKLVESELKRLGMSATDERAEAELTQLAKKNQMSMQEFENYLGSLGYTLEEYKQILKIRSERQSFFEKEIINKLRISDEDAYGVFSTKYPNYRASVGEFKIAQIFFSNKKGGAAAALARARATFDRLSAGEAYEVLANQLDETPGANKDGVLGVFKSGEFLPQIEKAMEGLSIGGTSSVLRGPNGYHIVKLLDKKTVLDPNFLHVKESIKAALVQQNFERQLKNWFELKKLDANIKIYNGAL